jgi:hypothetical protein
MTKAEIVKVFRDKSEDMHGRGSEWKEGFSAALDWACDYIEDNLDEGGV